MDFSGLPCSFNEFIDITIRQRCAHVTHRHDKQAGVSIQCGTGSGLFLRKWKEGHCPWVILLISNFAGENSQRPLKIKAL